MAVLLASRWVGGASGGLSGVAIALAGLGLAGSLLIIRYAFVSAAAELAWTGLFFASVTALALIAGLLGDPAPPMLMASLVGLIASVPALVGRTRSVVPAWRRWTIGWLGVIAVLTLLRSISRGPFPSPAPGSALAWIVAVIVVAGSLLLGWRHVRFIAISYRWQPILVAAGHCVVAAAAVAAVQAPDSQGARVVAAAALLAAVAASIGGLTAYQRPQAIEDLLAPIVAVDPLAALEIGLATEVTEYVTAEAAKGNLARDHVVRTAQLAIDVAALMNLDVDEQRRVGLVALLHDIGKLTVPDEVLDKQGPLSDQDWVVIKSHAAAGGAMVAKSAVLAELAPAIRGHHERLDGTGYPDALSGDDIPLAARIVAVCDAYDAMAYTRSYRSAMERSRVFEILREHAGSQWDPLVVQAVINVVSRNVDWEPRLLSGTGGLHIGCDCVPESVLPATLAQAQAAFTFHQR